MPQVSQGTRVNKSHKLQTNVPYKFKTGFLNGLDNRCGLAKTLRQNYEDIVEDIGGAEDCSHVKSALVERFVWLEGILQTLEHQMAEGEIDKSLSKWVQAVNSLSGLAKVLGVERRSSEHPWVTDAVVKEVTKNDQRQTI